MRCDDGTNMHGRYLVSQKNANTIYGRKVELNMWSGFIGLMMFITDGI